MQFTKVPAGRLIFLAHILAAALFLPVRCHAQGFQCIANAAVPPTTRAEGLTDIAGDIVLFCSGGTPASAGTVMPKTDITLFLNTQITSRVLSGGGEALLTIDEPTAAQTVLCTAISPNYCSAIAAGAGTPNTTEFKNGTNPNVIRGTVSGNSVTFTGVPLDPPGVSGNRIYRIIDVRANMSLIAPGDSGSPGQLLGLLSASDGVAMPITNPTQITAFVQPGLVTSLAAADGVTSLTSAAAFSQCTSRSAQRFATVGFSEQFPTAFKVRTVAGSGITVQNVIGSVYNAETAYYNPLLPGVTATSGLADFGTRLKAVFNNIPAGVALYTSTAPVTFSGGVPTVVTGGNPLTQLNAGLTATETGAYTPVTSTATLDGIPAVALPAVNGTATAIWEVVGANPLAYETFRFPLWISYNPVASGTAIVNTGFAPTPPAFSASGGAVAQDSTYPIPRFVDTSSAASLFQITSCGSTTAVTVATNPSGQTIVADGSTFTAPQTFNWTQGSTHTLSVAAGAANNGVRTGFVSWSDSGAATHTIATPASAATYTATFGTQYLLTLAPSPAEGGTVSASPASPTGDGYYASGTSVQVTATPNSGYQFASFSGALTGTANPKSLTLNAPSSVTANFATPSVMTSPAPNSTLTSSSVTFQWSAGTAASAYWLDVNSSCAGCGGGIFGQNEGLATSQTVDGIPTNGGAIYVRLWTQVNGSWQSNDYTYTALLIQSKAVMSSPAPGTTLGGSSVTFTWAAGSGASAYWLDINNLCRGCGGAVFGQNVGLLTSQTVNGIPTNGGTIYVRLWTLLGSTWQSNDYTYTAASSKAVMSTPAPGSTLTGSSVTFNWTAGLGASAYWLDVNNSCAGCGGGLFGQNVGLAISQTVSGLPVNGNTIYVRLWTQLGSSWQSNDYTYTASGTGTKATMSTPAPGSTLTGASVTFNWVGTGASAYWLDVNKTCAGCGGFLFGKNVGSATSQTVDGLPTDGSTLYVRLWTQLGSSWQSNDYTYTASGTGTKAMISTPTPGSTLGGTSVIFSWVAGTGASAYWLDVNNSCAGCGGGIFGQNEGLVTSQLVSGLPGNGSTVYVRLWTLLGSNWQSNDYTYTASGTGTKATMSTPTPGSALTGSSVTFTWAAGIGATAYWLDVNSSCAGCGGGIFGQNEGLATSQLVNGIPTNGGAIYVRLWTQLGGSWVFNDYAYTASH